MFEDKRIVFFGTPEFAAYILDFIIKKKFNVVGVITAADKPAGRGLKLTYSPVKIKALELQIPLLQPEKLKDPDFLSQLTKFNADIQLVVAFKMLPEQVWNLPPLGTINLHTSLLPQYRGAAPMHWAIINGENETGLTTFQLQHEIDTGKILLQEKISIDIKDTVGCLHDKMINKGAQLVVDTLIGIFNKTIIPKAQTEIKAGDKLKAAPKIKNEDCFINWHQPVVLVYNFIRGLNPFPGAITKTTSGELFKIFDIQYELSNHEFEFGLVYYDAPKKTIKIACQGGFILVSAWQPQGKKKMLVLDYLNGNQPPVKFILN